MKIIGEVDVCGDIHGEFGAVQYWISHSNVPNLIIVGDIGYGFKGVDSKITELGNKLNKAGKRVYAIRGNHDLPHFDNRIYGGEYGGFHLIKDGTAASWNGKTILFNGGCISIDRSKRIEGRDYWSDEIFVGIYDNLPEKIDYLVTHNAPPEVTGIPLYGDIILHYAGYDADLIADLTEENYKIRNWVDFLIERQSTQIEEWYYGHHHRTIESEYNGIKCRCVNINEIRPFGRKLY